MAQQRRAAKLEDDPLWYKDAIVYEVPVRAFFDSDNDGAGDFKGLEAKLDYIQDLGVTAIWLLPFCPSPWKDDGYDISDYYDVHPAYGSLRDFQSFLKEAHRRGLRVITELVMNHTSDQHAWFQRARQAPANSRWRDFYVWSDSPDKYKDARIIFKDTETSNWSWDPVAKAYYWHRFFSHQPDLNFDNPRVRRAMLDVVDFWFGMGVDGLRLDAVPYLFEREGTTCENLPETHAFLKELRRHIDTKFKNRMLLAEANQWPEDAIAYFGCGDESHMNFQFPLMPRLFMAMQMEDRFPIFDISEQTPPIPEICQWALFLRNHDELTLEMVTDEERDYMYRVYANDPQMRLNLGIRRRLAPLLQNDRRRIELMTALLLSLPGTPIIYYGDEIGMGDNFYLGDRDGVRTPMQWSADRNAGFSRANPQKLYLPAIIDPESHYEAVNVETQLHNPHSLLWFTKRMIALRREYKAFGRGSIEFLHPDNRKVLAFLRRYQDSTVLIVVNLSRFAQAAELDLSEFKSMMPVEVFGRSEFPPIGDLPYFVTLGPHQFYWFALEPQRVQVEYVSEVPAEESIPVLEVEDWEEIFTAKLRPALNRLLPAFLKKRRWFAGKDRRVRGTQIVDLVPAKCSSAMFFVNVEYGEGDPETYLLPLTLVRGEEPSKQVVREAPETVLTRFRGPENSEGALYGALWNREFSQELLDAISRRRRFRGEQGELFAVPSGMFRKLMLLNGGTLEPSLQRRDQTNTSVVYDEKFVLKVFRKLEPGINPELEMGYYLSEKVRFPYVRPLAGALEYRREGHSMTVGILHGYVPSQGNAWEFTLDSLGLYFERALARRRHAELDPTFEPSSMALLDQEIPPMAQELIGTYAEAAKLLGRRVAELHLALLMYPEDPGFAPEPFTDFYRQSLYHGMLGRTTQAFLLLRQRLKQIPEPALTDARHVLQLEQEIRRQYLAIRDKEISAARTRIHGNLHLPEVLYTGKDFVFIDFEGEPARALSERRIKRSPLRDVASMLRSFHYASHAALYGEVPGVIPRAEDRESLELWARYWSRWVSVAFLKEYLAVAEQAVFMPKTREAIGAMMFLYLLEKGVHEIYFELTNRPDWVRIPLRGILQLMEGKRLVDKGQLVES